jgi:biotin carboxylase
VERKRVLVVCPTLWDARQLAALPADVAARYDVVLDELHDDEVRWDLDLERYVEERVRRWRGVLAGVLSSSDYPGAVAAALIARALDLPGASPASLLRAGNKHASRLAQLAVAPDAVPRFQRVDPDDERTWPRDFPCFVKPVRGSFSVFARRVDDPVELRALVRSPALTEYREYQVRLFEGLAERHGDPAAGGARDLLAEELLDGEQVTVEGWVQRGRAHVLGIVDTAFHPGTRSVARFDLPSALAPATLARMGRIACDVALALGLDHTLFNVELFHAPESGRTTVIELNPRLCGQFGDLYLRVAGISGYALALAIACGESVALNGSGGTCAAAASVPLRTFESVRVRRAPGEAELAALARARPGLLAWADCRAGDVLRVAPEVEDGRSVRYAVVNLGGASRSDIATQAAATERALGFELERLPPAAGARSA